MEVRITYKGTQNGIKGVWCGFCPEDVEVEQEIPVLYADQGKILEKDGEQFLSVVLKDDDNIDAYVEIDAPEEEFVG